MLELMDKDYYSGIKQARRVKCATMWWISIAYVKWNKPDSTEWDLCDPIYMASGNAKLQAWWTDQWLSVVRNIERDPLYKGEAQWNFLRNGTVLCDSMTISICQSSELYSKLSEFTFCILKNKY